MKSLFIIFLAMTLLFVGLALAKPYEIEIKAKTLALPMPQGVARNVIEREILVTAYAEHGVMASGRWTYASALACPRDWPMGRKVEISGKEYTCEDHYNKRLSERLDMWLGDKEAAVKWGAQHLLVSYTK